MIKSPSEKTMRFLVWLIFVFFIGYVKLIYHELWKDEWQAWFVAKDKNIGEIFSFLYYEGHPALWYLYLKVFSLFADYISPEILIQSAHWITVIAGLYFLIIKFRIPLVLSTLTASSYFLFFEYGIVNRGYFLVVLFAFWTVALITEKEYNRKCVGILLFLLCQTEIYGVIIAFSLGIWLWLDQKQNIKTIKSPEIVALGFGILTFLISVFPRSAGHIAKTRSKELTYLDNVMTSIQGNLSNTYLIGSTGDTYTYGWSLTGIILSAVTLAGLYFLFRHHKRLLAIYIMYLIMMIGFSILFFSGGVRQWGMGFVFLITMVGLRGLDGYKDKIASMIVGIFCIFATIHNYKAIQEDIRLPFTNAKAAGLFIKEKVPLKVPVVAINKFESTPVIGYAGRKFYEMPGGESFSYFRWVDQIYLPAERELKLFAQYRGVGGLIIISPKPLDTHRYPSAQLWQKFDQENYKRENYFLYTLSK